MLVFEDQRQRQSSKYPTRAHHHLQMRLLPSTSDFYTRLTTHKALHPGEEHPGEKLPAGGPTAEERARCEGANSKHFKALPSGLRQLPADSAGKATAGCLRCWELHKRLFVLCSSLRHFPKSV